jgi:hypothetical protein
VLVAGAIAFHICAGNHLQLKMKSKMKKVIIPIALLLGINTVSAQAKQDFRYGLSEVTVAPFQKIRINANVQVVLVQNSSINKVFVEGDQRNLKNVIISSENGELVINPAAGFSGGDNLLLTIPAGSVKQVAIKGEAKVESIAAL